MSKLEQGGVVFRCEVDPKTNKVNYKRLRCIYTDTLTQDLKIPDGGAFDAALREVAKDPANEGVDGYDVWPWETKPNA